MGRKSSDENSPRRCARRAAKAEAQIEAKAAKAESKATKAEVKAAKAESKAAQSEAKAAKSAKATKATKATKAEAKATRAEAKAARATAKSAKAEAKSAKAEAKAAQSGSTISKAEARAARSAAKAAKAARSAGGAETKPARLLGKISDPKLAKRAVTVGKILAPALAPVLLKAATGTRGFLDTQRANRLGVPVSEVGAYRGPTGAVGARITGLSDAVRDLSQRIGNDLQVTRFTEVAGRRLDDMTAVVQACASMPRAKRSEVLHAVARELDEIDADLVAHLMAPRPR